MPVLMIRYQVADEGVTEVATAVENAFAAVATQQPDGIRYAYLRNANEFIALLALDENVENPLPGIEEARQLQATVAKWAVGTAPAPQPFEILGTYRVLD
ncbi:hypothetical protein [Actinocrispum wychmicini]|uniref:Antibiotic biosynthesis monooxygenase n=1 Tax=Actinocrispum wychmicini TaxID=1213861 RepID=A0A4V2S4E9_9PSEU|nr:hypothetical protein [Actinocrispum wychmicini]TCO47970.1 hypothetical protein EV192_11622 [Actinocrispum wychmicini]